GATMHFPTPGAPEAHVGFKNFGKTPAYDVRVWVHMWIERHPLRIELPIPGPDFKLAASIVPPGGPVDIYMPKVPPVYESVISLLGTPQGTIYVYGQVRYFDIYRKVERVTDYRLIWGGPERPREGRMGADGEGNSAT